MPGVLVMGVWIGGNVVTTSGFLDAWMFGYGSPVLLGI